MASFEDRWRGLDELGASLGMAEDSPADRAASRTRRAVRPEGGRREGKATKIAEATGTAIGRLGSGLIDSAVRGVMAPGNAYRSTADDPVTTEQMVGPAFDLASTLMGGAPGTAQTGAVGFFGGRLGNAAPALDLYATNWSALDSAEALKRIAQKRRDQGLGNGGPGVKSYPSAKARAAAEGYEAPEKGSWNDLVQRTKAQWDHDKAAARADYQHAANPLMSADDLAFIDSPGFSLFAGGDKRAGRVVRGLNAAGSEQSAGGLPRDAVPTFTIRDPQSWDELRALYEQSQRGPRGASDRTRQALDQLAAILDGK